MLLPLFSRGIESMLANAEVARQNMIENQVRPWEVLDPRVLDVLAAVRREDFVSARYRALAFADMALPIGNGEAMMKPTVEGRMLQALGLGAEDRVLEIGTGSGFVTACLARLASTVTSVEIHADLADAARTRIAAAGARNVRLDVAPSTLCPIISARGSRRRAGSSRSSASRRRCRRRFTRAPTRRTGTRTACLKRTCVI
jgi:SAM-dependent methyltransferase